MARAKAGTSWRLAGRRPGVGWAQAPGHWSGCGVSGCCS